MPLNLLENLCFVHAAPDEMAGFVQVMETWKVMEFNSPFFKVMEN